MTTRSARWLALGLAGLIVVAALQEEPAGYWAPEGFVSRANAIVGNGGLELRCGARDSIVVRLAPGTPDERFFRSSYLRADVRRFNADPSAARSPFLVDGCRLLGVDPFYHRVDLPYNRVPHWTGPVRFARAGQSAAFRGGRDQRLNVVHPLEALDATRSQRASLSRGEASARTAFLRFQAPRSPEVLAEAFFVGDEPVLADRRDVGAPSHLRLNGFAMPPGRIARLESGDWVQFEHRRQVFTYLVDGSDRAGLVSAVARGNGAQRRHLVPHLAPFVRDLAQAMEGGLQSTPSARDGGLVSRMEVRLTLDRDLETATQAVVDRWCERQRLPGRPRAVSALVMDAFGGDVLAMPTCPGEATLDDYGHLARRLRSRYLRNQNFALHPGGSALKPFWAASIATAFPALLDLEISPHAVAHVEDVFGCALPVPYGSAGHDGWEGLEAFLRTSCNRYMVEAATAALLAGAAGGGDAAECRAGGRGLAECLADAVGAAQATDSAGATGEASQTSEAGTAGPASGPGEADSASPAPEPPGREVRFCDQVVRLVLSDDLPFTGRTCGDLRLVGDRFAPALPLERLTGGAVYRDRTPSTAISAGLDDAYRAGRYRLDLWRGPIETLRAAGDTANPVHTALRFSAVSPQVTNLALNTIEELRRDWVNLLLGGENSRWSNFQLAEATARLMTGRDVRGRIVADPRSSTAREAPEPLPEDVLHPGARRRVLHAMEQVAGPGGTAARIVPAVRRFESAIRSVPGAEDHDVYVFAKTGTPAVSVPLRDRTATREGSVLVLGVLVVPPEAGRRASRLHRDWFSACPVASALEAGVLGVPPTRLLESATPGQNGTSPGAGPTLGFSAAFFLDDLNPRGGDLPATALAADLLEPLAGYAAQRLERQLRRRAFGN